MGGCCGGEERTPIGYTKGHHDAGIRRSGRSDVKLDRPTKSGTTGAGSVMMSKLPMSGTTASSPVLRDQSPPSPDRSEGPAISAIVEMNLEEYPAFRLGRRSKRIELRYVRTRPAPDGQTHEQVWSVRGTEGLGLPGPFEQDLYVALLVLFTEQGLPSDGRIRFTRNRLAQVIGISNSGRGYELIEQGLARLAGATVQTEHAFYRPALMGPDRERTGPTERLSLTFHILEEVRVYERAAMAIARRIAALDGDPLAGRVELARPMEVSFARLGSPLVQSYERRYTKGLDTTYYFHLTRPLSRRLFRYLDKVRNRRGSFEIGLRTLADVLGLEYRFQSDIKVGLAEAHEELRATGYLSGAQYLPMAGGPGAGEKACYAFDPAFDARPRRRAGSVLPTSEPETPDEPRMTPALLLPSPSGHGVRAPEAPAVPSPSLASDGRGDHDADFAQRVQTLVEMGITASRAERLVASYPGAHIDTQVATLRDRLARARSGQSGVIAPRNPGGYLAQAIVDGFTAPRTGTSSGSYAVVRDHGAGEAAKLGMAGSDASGQVATDPPAVIATRILADLARGAPSMSAPHAPVPGLISPKPGELPGLSPETVEDPSPTPGAIVPAAFANLCEVLRASLTPATYGAWVAPLQAQRLPIRGEGLGRVAMASEPGGHLPGGPPEGTRPSGGETIITVRVQNRFALSRWGRSPLSEALAAAEKVTGTRVQLIVDETA